MRITDENDEAPEFAQEDYLFTVTENMTAPVTVGTTQATDRDEGEIH